MSGLSHSSHSAESTVSKGVVSSHGGPREKALREVQEQRDVRTRLGEIEGQLSQLSSAVEMEVSQVRSCFQIYIVCSLHELMYQYMIAVSHLKLFGKVNRNLTKYL